MGDVTPFPKGWPLINWFITTFDAPGGQSFVGEYFLLHQVPLVLWASVGGCGRCPPP
jgi:hypothetical protein